MLGGSGYCRPERTFRHFRRSRADAQRERMAMKPVGLMLAAAASLAVAGCYSPQRAEEHAQDMAADQCAQQGKQFVQTSGSAAATPVVTGATAKGRCVGPGDAGYVPPPP